MDYEKKYNDALNLAKSYYGEGSNEFLDTIFPELRESEDERHRKWILEYLYDGLQKSDEQFKDQFKSAISWLEKQKESLHISETCKENADSFTSACKDVIVAIEKYLDWLTGYPDYAPKGKYSIRDMLHCLYVLEKQKEQKPPITGNDFGWIDELKHDLEHPEELDEKVDDVLKQRKGIRTLEWSEEDERKRQACISTINEVIDYERERWEDYNPGKPYRPIMKYDEQIDWLKSLRPSWKPSEEQMEALNYFIKLWGNSDEQLEYTKIFNTVKSLRDELKKLGVKEEPEYYQHFDPDC